mmetsp:Transcript_108325/g.312090  ORF Transcript_108325/g.312090 Transcript_108325/m.312090 type:complete len:103 (-) Transcript_108325:383-691(-)
MFDFLAQVRFGNLFHFSQYHSTDFLRCIFGFRMLACNLLVQFDQGFSMLVIDNAIWKQFLVTLHRWIIVVASNKSFDIKKGSSRILSCLILGGITHQTSSIL